VIAAPGHMSAGKASRGASSLFGARLNSVGTDASNSAATDSVAITSSASETAQEVAPTLPPKKPGERTPLVPEGKEGRLLPRDAPSLNFVRLVAAVHIVAFHFVTAAPAKFIAQWGQAWVPFFFMMSGFGPAHSRLMRTPVGSAASVGIDVLPSASTLTRRLLAVWPLYALALLFTVVLTLSQHPPWVDRPPLALDGPLLTLEFLMLHDWLPTAVRNRMLGTKVTGTSDYRYNPPGWYVSTLAFFWLLESALFKLHAAAARCGGGLGVFYALFLLLVWMAAWPFGSLPSVLLGRTLISSVQAPHPIVYMHQYAFGVWLAFFVHHRAAANRPPLLCGWAFSLASASLVAVFTLFRATDRVNLKEFGVLMPLYALLILGAIESSRGTNSEQPLSRDLGCRLLSVWPLPLIGNELAYPVYILQEPVHVLLNLTILRQGVAPGVQFAALMGSLLLLALLAALCVQRPAMAGARYLLPQLMGARQS
jgi:peptidoglycan/LPS O-acetylase OafA/YrhL